MDNLDKLVASAMVCFFMLLNSNQALAGNADTPTPATEKCYGVVKAGTNDCATATTSCAGSSTKDSQPDAFLFVPVGLCDKLVGGSLKESQRK